uniref:Uncharacterized protein n=1 Tax=Timema genevievae TaxID=629358 RepID=A0A7R9JW08_TIMGE|nr:unnamed protein product [Timema genevievae]
MQANGVVVNLAMPERKAVAIPNLGGGQIWRAHSTPTAQYRNGVPTRFRSTTPLIQAYLTLALKDLESECYPCMTMKCRDSYSPITVKEEPLSEPASPQSVTSCYPMSPCSSPPLLHAEIYQQRKTHIVGHVAEGVKLAWTDLPVGRRSAFESQLGVLNDSLRLSLHT